jgi:hypothetical protein
MSLNMTGKDCRRLRELTASLATPALRSPVNGYTLRLTGLDCIRGLYENRARLPVSYLGGWLVGLER